MFTTVGVGARGSKLPAFCGQNRCSLEAGLHLPTTCPQPDDIESRKVAMGQPMISVSRWGLRRVAASLLSCFLLFTALPGNPRKVLAYHQTNARTAPDSKEYELP